MRELSEGIESTLEMLFAGVLVGGIDLSDSELKVNKRRAFRQNLPRFLNRFSYNIFEQEYAVFWELLNRIKGGVFTASQINAVLENNTDIILKSKHIDLSEFIGLDDQVITDEEKFIAFKEKVLRRFKELSNKLVDEDEYKSAVEIYIDWYADTLALETAQKMTLIMSDDGLTVRENNGRRRLYKGIEDYSKYYSKQEAIWKSLKENKGKRDILIDAQWLKIELESIDSPNEEGILDTGLEPIDKTITKFCRGHLVNIVGQTKGGKTRYVNYLVSRALDAGLNVAVWPLEGSVKEWTSCQEACLIFKEYAASEFEAGKYTTTNDSGVIVIDTDRLANKQFKNAVEREAAVEAKTKLATDYNRGKLSFIDETCYVETFCDVLDSHYDNCNQFDVLVMDSPVVIQSRTGITERERIAMAFISLKSWGVSKVRKPLMLTTTQLKQEVIDELRRNKNKEMDVTAAGGSAETVRTPDEVIGIFSSKESRDNGQVTLESIASRHHANFEKFICSAALGSCYFTYRPELQEVV